MAAKLGPDPLREDADGELLWMKMQTSRKPVGLILMDQTAVAGVGNIYRAEILFKVKPAHVHRFGCRFLYFRYTSLAADLTVMC